MVTAFLSKHRTWICFKCRGAQVQTLGHMLFFVTTLIAVCQSKLAGLEKRETIVRTKHINQKLYLSYRVLSIKNHYPNTRVILQIIQSRNKVSQLSVCLVWVVTVEILAFLESKILTL